MLVAAEDVLPGEDGHVRLARHPGGQHELLRPQLDRLAVALDGRPATPGSPRRSGAVGASVLRPVVELHHPGVRLQPVGDLVLGREHRPVVRELDVGQVVVPDRVVQAERLVAAAPLVAGPGVLVDDDRRDAELPQPGAERDAALAAADDQRRRAGWRSRARAASRSRRSSQVSPVAVGAVLGALRAAVAGRLLVALELVQGGEQRPGAVPSSRSRRWPAAPADRRLELRATPR